MSALRRSTERSSRTPPAKTTPARRSTAAASRRSERTISPNRRAASAASITSSADPQLGTLADNDGPTNTHLPALASPAVDASTLGSPNADQRGVTRPDGVARDIGSVEVVHNQPPVAVCQDITVAADASCLGHVTTEDVDNGSSDPDGDPLTFTLDPPWPYPLGDTIVTLTVTDDGDLSDSCQATITVVDETPPDITCPPDVVLECPADTSPAATGTATATARRSTIASTIRSTIGSSFVRSARTRIPRAARIHC